ncbi:MAG: alpha-amylase [Myxococcota bacterium]
MNRSILLVAATLVGTTLGCGDDSSSPTDAGPPTPDGGVTPDASVPDTGTSPDAGPPAVRIDVSSVFSPGTSVRDAYTGASATVDATGNVEFLPGDQGVILIERQGDEMRSPPFTWDNATVYFAFIDRFENGDASNDNGYGRDFTGMPDTGTFHGGDLKGLTARLDHIAAVGANALWITAPFEQIHGYVGGGGGAFPHFAYAGYWALDFTRLDANFGTPEDLRALVREAHARGIRVIFDVVMNHPGYASLNEIATYFPAALKTSGWETWRPGAGESWSSYNDLFIDFNHPDWRNWWGPEFIRAGLPGYDGPGNDDLKQSLAFLPDFKTEEFRSTTGLPPILAAKTDTAAVMQADFTVRQYLIEWLTTWVREYGIDGFRCDTAKHVELEAWAELEQAGTAALRDWKTANPAEALDDLEFWMTGEVFPHGVLKDDFYTQGRFDSLINFDFKALAAEASRDSARLESIYSGYASALNSDPEFNVLTYISSHDTTLFFETTGRDLGLQYDVGTAMMLLPGGIQIFYGDETARPAADGNGDSTAGTRSDMNWDDFDTALLDHWQRLGQFRNRHPAVGSGAHRALFNDGSTYVFSRTTADEADAVVIALTRPGE